MNKRPTQILYAILSFAFILMMGAGHLKAQTATANTLQHPKDQIALQLGAIQMGYTVPFTLTGNISVQKMQQAVNALVMGRNSLNATVAKPAVQVVGAVDSPSVDTVEYRDQIYAAVEYVVTSPVVATIKGNATLTGNKKVSVAATKLTVPTNAWTIPVPYALESRSSADVQELANSQNALASNFTNLQIQTSGFSSNLAAMQGQVTSVSNNASAAVGAVNALSGNVATLASEQNYKLAQLEATIQSLRDELEACGVLTGCGSGGNATADMIPVQGGTLPESSALAGQVVTGFLIGKYEVTWGEWKTVRDWAVSNGYSDLAGVGAGNGDNFPVTDVSWYDVVKWSNARSEKEGLTPVYQVSGTTYKTGEASPTLSSSANGYRLPSEKEWEWAARGGVSSQGYTYSGSNTASEVGWTYDNSGGGSNAVGTKAANELGIYDMSGNVFEWCEDVAYTSYRCSRGGSWDFDVDDAAVANRFLSSSGPDYRINNIGFRLARSSGNMVTVQGGTLPASSGLGNQTVETFQIGKYEVTWGEWKTVRDWAVSNGYTDLAGVGDTYPSGSGDNFPVCNVSWYDVVKWSNARSEKEGLTPVYRVSGTTFKTGESLPSVNSTANGYRLPSEKEWEWAARGGVSSQGYTYSGSNTASVVAWTSANSQDDGTKAVGTKAANELGIYDMSGNVWEWCEDVAYSSYRRIRGGSWSDDFDVAFAAVANRDYYNIPVIRDNDFGFRLARSSGN